MQPINNITWVDVERLKANDYNPNYVFQKEMLLLKYSILKNGWLHPIIINKDYTIIDGYHRATLTKTDKEINQLTHGQIPCIVLNMEPTERKLMTIRINRAKGTHTAYKMHKVITDLYNEGIEPEHIATEIGATNEEIQLLLTKNVFEYEKIDDNTKYNQAWTPK